MSIANVYLPPTGNLARRALTEETVRSQAETVLTKVPHTGTAVLCGDFNARTGSLLPALEGSHMTSRYSADQVICPRGWWLLEKCVLHHYQILNGLYNTSTGYFTCFKHNGISVVDCVFA